MSVSHAISGITEKGYQDFHDWSTIVGEEGGGPRATPLLDFPSSESPYESPIYPEKKRWNSDGFFATWISFNWKIGG